MSERLSWWVIPGALVVLVRVVTLGDSSRPALPVRSVPPAAPAVEVASGPVVVRDASGVRSAPMLLPVANALVISLPKECVGQKVQLSLWRRTAAGRETTAWITASPVVRDDAVLPIGGQPAGRYDVEVSYGSADAPVHLQRDDVAVPGEIDLRPSR